MHPHQFSLDLLKNAIEKAPAAFPAERRAAMRAAHEALFANPHVSIEEIEKTLVEFGKEIWPHRKAYQKIHDDYGKDGIYLTEKLTPATRTKYEVFLSSGGQLEDIRGGSTFEEIFSPEEKLEIDEAWLEARERAHKEIDALIAGEKKREFDELVGEFRSKLNAIEAKIEALRALAQKSDKWAPEILDKVKTFERGWSGAEKEVTEEDVKGEIEYYEGVMEI